MSLFPLKTLWSHHLPESVYIELIDELFSATPSIIVFAITQCVIGAAIFAETGDGYMLGLTIVALLVSSERIWMIHTYHRTAATSLLTYADAPSWERRFALRSVATGILVSAMGVRCFMLTDPAVHTLMVAVLFSYAAGTITRVSFRPRLALFNLAVVAIPPAIACLLLGSMIYVCLSFSMVIFMVGAIDVIRHSYDTIVSQLMLKRRFAGLAQRDALTGLTNRLGLNENLEAVMADAQRNGYGLAVHSLDLDRFKAANDLYGHATGDAILKEVAQRLTRLTRATDLLVRLGGDEFVLVQTGVETREQATTLALRIIDEISSYYNVRGYAVEIGTSVGIAIMADEELTPDDLLARADQALYQAKRARSGYAVYAVAPHLVPPLVDGDDFQDFPKVMQKKVRLG